MEIKRTNWTNNCMETKRKENQRTTQTKMGRQNKIIPEDIGSNECRKNGKRPRRLETICCSGNGPKRPVKIQRRRRIFV
ncbi:Hypothetical protein CINCED_3A014971 [Cinara cedri]|uniref:Uncharacterized protein n=1 Tax=Cinara cedri TaxID=506608 RepID=A0A5E4M423_9HEMI|nr:Hypothetical protein CINCED_3A014971 [Cinara cedri]